MTGLLAHIPWTLYLAGMLTLAVVTGYLFYRFVDQPLNRTLHRGPAMAVA